MPSQGPFIGSQGRAAFGILGGAVALLYASTYMEVRGVKKTEGNMKVHGRQERPEHISPEAEAAVTHPPSHSAADSK